jgi:hypothetical protein
VRAASEGNIGNKKVEEKREINSCGKTTKEKNLWVHWAQFVQ